MLGYGDGHIVDEDSAASEWLRIFGVPFFNSFAFDWEHRTGPRPRMAGQTAVAPARPWPASVPDVRGSSAGISANDNLL